MFTYVFMYVCVYMCVCVCSVLFVKGKEKDNVALILKKSIVKCTPPLALHPLPNAKALSAGPTVSYPIKTSCGAACISIQCSDISPVITVHSRGDIWRSVANDCKILALLMGTSFEAFLLILLNSLPRISISENFFV